MKKEIGRIFPQNCYISSPKSSLDICYFFRGRVICKRWFSSTLLSDPPQQQLPWLIEFHKTHNPYYYGTLLKKKLRFYSFASGETGSIPIHESHCCEGTKAFIRPGHSYLLVRDRIVHDMSLLNPLTNKVISLPVIHPCFAISWPIVWGEGPNHNSQWHLLYVTMTKICYFATHQMDKMGFQYVVHDNNLSRTCYWRGMIFATEAAQSTLVFDAASGNILYSIPPPKDEYPHLVNPYIVESRGLILRVSWHFPYGRYLDVEASIFHIYALSFVGENKQPCWVQVSDIGNQIVFLDTYSGFSASATIGLQGNCIYILKQNSNNTPCHYYLGSKLWRYDIATGTVEMVPCPFKSCMWFIPSLH